MSSINYWDGTAWKPISVGGGGGGGGGTPGPAGPPGADGKSVNVYGPQVAQPVPARKGDIWLAEAVAVRSVPDAPGLVSAPESPASSLADPPPPVTYPTLKE